MHSKHALFGIEFIQLKWIFLFIAMNPMEQVDFSSLLRLVPLMVTGVGYQGDLGSVLG